MAITIFDQRELLEIRRDMRLAAPTDYWRKRFFGATHFSQNLTIDFGDITETRAMAPFAQPSHMGKPIVKEKGASVQRFQPGYIKLLDAVRPQDATTLTPEEMLTGDRLDLQTRFDLRTAEVSRQHMDAIYRTWDWMCAKAIINGAVTVKYDQEQGLPNPEVTISFGRDANLTVTGVDWSNAAADILGDLGTWVTRARKAKFGAIPTDIIVGSDVAPIFSKNTGLKALLSTQIRGGEGTNFNLGVQSSGQWTNAPSYIGSIAGVAGNLNIWTYSDQQMDDAGNMIDVLSPKDIIMMGGDPGGMMAFGAIYDVKTIGGNIRTDIFQKQYEEENPSSIQMLTQSAPLPIVRFPNRTFKATVLP